MSPLVLLLVIGLVIGFVFTPLLIIILRDGLPLKGQIGRALFLLGQLAHGGSLAYARSNGDVELCPFDADAGEVYVDGEWITPDGEIHEYRLGLRPFAISAEKPSRFISHAIDDPPETEVQSDGGPVILAEERGGYGLFSWFPDPPSNSLLVNVPRYISQMGRQGDRVLNRTEEVALRDFGGASKLSQMKFGLLVFATMFIMFVTTFVMLRVL